MDSAIHWMYIEKHRMKQSMTQVSFRVEEAVKEDAEALFGRLGMSLSTALNIFLRQSIARRGLPFEVQEADPFWHPANQRHLAKGAAAWARGAEGFAAHELVDAGDE